MTGICPKKQSVVRSDVCRAAKAFLSALVLSALLAGCTNTLDPPAPRSLENPVVVILIDHGRHPSLLLPDGNGAVRYTSGEWRWYARNETGPLRALHGILWPTRAALGRYRVDRWPEQDDLVSIIPEGYRELLEFRVERARARALRERLNTLFEQSAEEFDQGAEEARVYNARYQLEFVPLDESYWLANQSNQRMIAWLRELGVEVEGPGLYSTWRLTGDQEY